MPVRELRPEEVETLKPVTPETITPKQTVRELAPEEVQKLQPPGSMVGPIGPVESGSEAMRLGQESLEIANIQRQKKQTELTNILGDFYSPQNFDDEAVDPEFGNPTIAQADLARSLTLTDKQKKWRDVYYPQGDIISVPTSDGEILLGRESKDRPYREIGLGETLTGALVSEPTVLGAAGSFFTPLGTLAGTFAGSQIQQRVEEERGYGEGYTVIGSLKEALIAAGLDVAFRGMGRAITGRPKPLSELEALKEATKAVQDLGLEPIAIGQVGGPLERGMFRQVGVTSPRIEQKITKQQESLLEAFRNLGDDIPSGYNEDTLLDVVKAQQNELRGILDPRQLRRADAGEALQRGLETWKKASSRLRDIYYRKAVALSDDVRMSLAPAKRIAEQLDLGIVSIDKSGNVVRLDEPLKGELKDVVQLLKSLPESVDKITVRRIDSLPSPQKLLGEPPIEAEFTAFEQIKALRTRLFDIMHEGEGAAKRHATILWKAMTKVMDNPISGDPNFVKSYQKASAFNRLREDTLEKSFVARALKQDTPEIIARRYTQPFYGSELLEIKSLVPRPAWNDFKEAFMMDIMNAPTARQGLSRLNNWQHLDPDSLRILVTEEEEKLLENFLKTRQKFDTGPTRKIMEQNLTEGEQFVALAKQGTAGDVRDAIRLSGGKNSDYALAAKAGVYKDILDNSTSMTQLGQEVIDITKLLGNISKWKKTNKLDELFTPADWQKLKLYERYTAAIQATADIGGGMMAGSLRQKIAQAPAEAVEKGGLGRIAGKIVRPLIANEVTAWLLTRAAKIHRYHRPGALFPLSQIQTMMVNTIQQYKQQKPRKTPLPEAVAPVYHTGGQVRDYGKIAANLEKMSDINRKNHLTKMFKENRKDFDRLMGFLENGNS
jgi:hypothetical protein